MLGEYIASAPLTPLVKPGGGNRPIAVGIVWRRLVSEIRDSFNLSLQAWYLDDGTIVGDTLVVGEVFLGYTLLCAHVFPVSLSLSNVLSTGNGGLPPYPLLLWGLVYIQQMDLWKSQLEDHTSDWLQTVPISENGAIRPKKYVELSEQEMLQDDCDVQAINIVLQGLPLDVYALVNHCQATKEI
ncbi:hypothetical protein Tco_0184718 [Tanacetum coccineum]